MKIIIFFSYLPSNHNDLVSEQTFLLFWISRWTATNTGYFCLWIHSLSGAGQYDLDACTEQGLVLMTSKARKLLWFLSGFELFLETRLLLEAIHWGSFQKGNWDPLFRTGVANLSKLKNRMDFQQCWNSLFYTIKKSLESVKPSPKIERLVPIYRSNVMARSDIINLGFKPKPDQPKFQSIHAAVLYSLEFKHSTSAIRCQSRT